MQLFINFQIVVMLAGLKVGKTKTQIQTQISTKTLHFLSSDRISPTPHG